MKANIFINQLIEGKFTDLAPKEMVRWNNTRGRVNIEPEDRSATDAVPGDPGWGPRQLKALERQNALFASHRDEMLDTSALLYHRG